MNELEITMAIGKRDVRNKQISPHVRKTLVLGKVSIFKHLGIPGTG
jgi:hypothetical protein